MCTAGAGSVTGTGSAPESFCHPCEIFFIDIRTQAAASPVQDFFSLGSLGGNTSTLTARAASAVDAGELEPVGVGEAVLLFVVALLCPADGLAAAELGVALDTLPLAGFAAGAGGVFEAAGGGVAAACAPAAALAAEAGGVVEAAGGGVAACVTGVAVGAAGGTGGGDGAFVEHL